mgnify:CR=1 FL=1
MGQSKDQRGRDGRNARGAVTLHKLSTSGGNTATAPL